MTDRLAELHQGHTVPDNSADAVDDIEAGLTAEQDAVLGKFNKEADAIDRLHTWAHETIAATHPMLQNTSALPAVEQKLDLVEKKLDAVRKRLKRIAGENKNLAAAGSAPPSSMRIRVSRYTKLGKDFMAVTSELEAAREAHKNIVKRAVKHDILSADPSLAEADVDRVLEEGVPLESVVTADNRALHYQIEDLRARNDDIQKLSKNIVALHQMFTDMSILVDGQQELINDIEYNVKEVKNDTKKAAEELVEARKHQKSARKKKMCICILVVIIIVAIAAAILIPMAIKNGWFTGGNNNNNDGGSQSTTAPPATTLASARRNLDDLPKVFVKSRRYN